MIQPDDIRHSGLKVTVPRLLILELFKSRPTRHLSAEDVYRELLSTHSEMRMVTVYRVLSQLEQAGLLRRSVLQPGKAVYELEDGRSHAHLLCADCGHIEEFHDDVLEERQAMIAAELGFRLLHREPVLYGSCTKSACEFRPASNMADSGPPGTAES